MKLNLIYCKNNQNIIGVNNDLLFSIPEDMKYFKKITSHEYVKDNIEVLQWVDLDLKDKNILIVDEIDDTRKTLDFCINRLKTRNNANNIGVFVLQNKLKNKVSVLDKSIEYFACENIEDKWVVYPWD